MIDFAKIAVKAGHGGNGAGSFLHIKGKRLGKADGGNGGCGGDIYIVSSPDLNTLEPFRFVKEYKAQNGTNGSSRRRRGADGEDLVIKVPVGTIVRSGEEVYDLVQEVDKVLVARGGEGGRGNCHLRDELGRRPKAGEVGEAGEVKNLTLELKLIADIGIIGFPNSGKSTLLSVLTSARPAIASYPFTTLEPNLGVLEMTADGRKQTAVLADIPGLIEGASTGKGLGDLFLRHIERTKILVHLIDVSGQLDKLTDYKVIREELKKYSKELASKKEIIVLTKIDLVEKNTVEKIKNEFRAKRKKVIAISAIKREGLENLKKEMLRIIKKTTH